MISLIDARDELRLRWIEESDHLDRIRNGKLYPAEMIRAKEVRLAKLEAIGARLSDMIEKGMT